MTQQFSHVDDKGAARMVDVSEKDDTERSATAKGEIVMAPETLALIQEGGVKKGDVLSAEKLAERIRLAIAEAPVGSSATQSSRHCERRIASAASTRIIAPRPPPP